ncbi:MAG: DegT/DnrJ/EryC1/StrS family aminotransferase, partial [Candidatus Sericytochromatia bacterium]|nr:DegT/DnrJ/EryC1/StrS family aminotransferase [Candidatus Tanganyikabacteria bacterium]
GPGDEVIVPAMTFAATANCVLYQGATPIFADIDRETLLISPADAYRKVSPRTKAIIGVDYAGHPADYRALDEISRSSGIPLLADACHSLGASMNGATAGSLALASAFSLHPVKPITTGEGGVVTTDDGALARRLKTFRNHGITTDHRERDIRGDWFYEMVDLGYNYRLSDIQCALGISQLTKLRGWVDRRQTLASRYDRAFSNTPWVRPLRVLPGVSHAYHLYVVRVPAQERGHVFRELRRQGIGVQVHYVPVHLHPYYQNVLGTGPGTCPAAEAAYEEILSLPIFPAMTEDDVDFVVSALCELLPAKEVA